jgi:hypothetical protein
MKRFFTLVMLTLAIHTMANAQSFEFKYKGEVYANGSTLVINAETDMFGELACETNPASNPDDGLLIVGKDGAYLAGSAHLAILEHTFKAKTVQWCMSDACVPMKEVTELDKTFEGTSIRVLFDAFTIRQEGFLLAKLDVTVGGESQSLYIEFSNGQHSSVSSMKVVEGRADVYDLNGRLVMAAADASARQMLRSGVYVVKSGTQARKVVVR